MDGLGGKAWVVKKVLRWMTLTESEGMGLIERQRGFEDRTGKKGRG